MKLSKLWKTMPLMVLAVLCCAAAYYVTQSLVYVGVGVIILILGLVIWFSDRKVVDAEPDKNETDSL